MRTSWPKALYSPSSDLDHAVAARDVVRPGRDRHRAAQAGLQPVRVDPHGVAERDLDPGHDAVAGRWIAFLDVVERPRCARRARCRPRSSVRAARFAPPGWRLRPPPRSRRRRHAAPAAATRTRATPACPRPAAGRHAGVIAPVITPSGQENSPSIASCPLAVLPVAVKRRSSPLKRPSACSAEIFRLVRYSSITPSRRLKSPSKVGWPSVPPRTTLPDEPAVGAVDLRHQQRQDLDRRRRALDAARQRGLQQLARAPLDEGLARDRGRLVDLEVERRPDLLRIGDQVEAAAAEADALVAELVARHVDDGFVEQHRGAADPVLARRLLGPAARLQPAVELAPAEHRAQQPLQRPVLGAVDHAPGLRLRPVLAFDAQPRVGIRAQAQRRHPLQLRD